MAGLRLGDYKVVVVGSGFFGSVIAHEVASHLAQPVLVLEKRSHIGGNSYSELDSDSGIEIHKYGTHLFHTSNELVWEFISRFTAFNNYRHRVFSKHAGRVYSMPINLMTINNFFGLSLDPAEAAEFMAVQRGSPPVAEAQNLEEKAISMIGRQLYEAFVRGYTAKQWETDPSELPASIIARLPVRLNYNDFYFSDRFEGLPLEGYHSVFQRMLASDLIDVRVNCDFFDVRDQISPTALIVFTGPIDRYYDFRFGRLGWRTLDFEIDRLDLDDFQGAAVVNYADREVPYTRIHEFKHLHPERTAGAGKTIVMREFSRFALIDDEPYYPIGTQDDQARYDLYRALASQETRVLFGGRLGTYRYLDMHQAIGAALKCYDRQVRPALTSQAFNPTEDA